MALAWAGSLSAWALRPRPAGNRCVSFLHLSSSQSCPTFCDPMDRGNWQATVQFSSVAQSCLTLCDPMDCSTPGFPVHHQLPKLAQTYVHQVTDTIQLSHPLIIPFSSLQSFPASGSFPMSQFFASGGQSVGASASATVLLMSIQG